MIISASRRTDIPAFYSAWFMNRIRDGYALIRNPFNAHQIRKVSLLKEDVDVIVFWTRNADHLIEYLPILDRCGYRYYFQYTITGYPRVLEKSVPNTRRAIESFIKLSNRVGKEKVIWRYDPILLSNKVDMQEHKRLFEKIASLLYGRTETVVISFADFYQKTVRNLNKVDELIFSDIVNEQEALLELCRYCSEIAFQYGMSIESCAENIDTSSIGIPHGKCIDDVLIKRLFDLDVCHDKDKGKRDECGCVKSVDIGSYNTCLHECAYCYATFNKHLVINNKKKHNPNSPFLVGELLEEDKKRLFPEHIQTSLFD